jgi:hypothetical protein
VLRPTGSVYLHCDPTARHYLSEDVRRGGNDRSHPGVYRNAGSIGAVRPTRTQRLFARWRQGMVDLGPLGNSELTTVQLPCLHLAFRVGWRRDPGESGALHCPDPARPRPWIKTSSVV